MHSYATTSGTTYVDAIEGPSGERIEMGYEQPRRDGTELDRMREAFDQAADLRLAMKELAEFKTVATWWRSLWFTSNQDRNIYRKARQLSKEAKVELNKAIDAHIVEMEKRALDLERAGANLR